MSQFNHGKTSFSFRDPVDYQSLRDVLEAAGYNDSGVLEAVGTDDARSIQESDVPLLLNRTNGGSPLDTLIRLFLIEVPCDAEAVQSAFKPMELETLAEAGLIEIDGKSVNAAVRLLPFKGLIIAYDLPTGLQSAVLHDYVMGIGASSLTLAGLIVRRQARMTLDLGTGCGIQALLAAGHSDRVLAVDLNPRAVRLAAFNARLNGLSNVECLEGNLFEPALGYKFDLVITNPPFVISPEMRYVYRDSGMEADQVCEMIVRQVPQFLEEGGYCQMLCNWVHPTGQDWQERLAGWFEGTGCDAWVIGFETQEPDAYASTWIRHTERAEREEYAERFEKWMAYYKQQGIEAISDGLISIRRSSSKANWYRFDDAPKKMMAPCGDHIVRRFELRDFLETMEDDPALLRARLRAAPDVQLERQYKPSGEGWREAPIQIQLNRGFCYSGTLDPLVANMVLACDGKKPLSELMAKMATALGKDPTEIAADFCKIVRGLIERGFLLPADFNC